MRLCSSARRTRNPSVRYWEICADDRVTGAIVVESWTDQSAHSRDKIAWEVQIGRADQHRLFMSMFLKKAGLRAEFSAGRR